MASFFLQGALPLQMLRSAAGWKALVVSIEEVPSSQELFLFLEALGSLAQGSKALFTFLESLKGRVC